MITHTQVYDRLLNKIEHFNNFPAMKPYIGENYENKEYPKILLVGESNYLPQNSVISKNALSWYQATEADLTHEEINWIHCRQLLECDWKSDGHMIYRELENNLKSYFKSEMGKRSITNLAYINGFQRPSPSKGDSISKFLTEIDIKNSSEVLTQVISIIKPNAVVFVSKLAWDKLRWKLKVDKEINLNFTCHPGTGGRFWHNKNYKHGRNKFNRIMSELIQSIHKNV